MAFDKLAKEKQYVSALTSMDVIFNTTCNLATDSPTRCDTIDLKVLGQYCRQALIASHEIAQTKLINDQQHTCIQCYWVARVDACHFCSARIASNRRRTLTMSYSVKTIQGDWKLYRAFGGQWAWLEHHRWSDWSRRCNWAGLTTSPTTIWIFTCFRCHSIVKSQWYLHINIRLGGWQRCEASFWFLWSELASQSEGVLGNTLSVKGVHVMRKAGNTSWPFSMHPISMGRPIGINIWMEHHHLQANSYVNQTWLR